MLDLCFGRMPAQVKWCAVLYLTPMSIYSAALGVASFSPCITKAKTFPFLLMLPPTRQDWLIFMVFCSSVFNSSPDTCVEDVTMWKAPSLLLAKNG